LANPKSNLYQEPEKNKIIFIPFYLLKTYISNPYLFFISFFTLPPKGNTDGNHDPRAYMRGEVSFAKFLFFQVDLPS
jgi:hypothetical protein